MVERSFDISKKSALNQGIVDAAREDNRTRRRRVRAGGPLMPSPRFAPHVMKELPYVPNGMVLVKFHGEPQPIPARLDDEPFYGNSPFTSRQIEAMQRMSQSRAMQVLDSLNAGATYDRNLTVEISSGEYPPAYGV